MEFSSYTFLFLFLPAVVVCYFLTPKKGRTFVLFLASLGFYLWSDPIYFILLVFLLVFDYLWGLLLYKNHVHRRLCLALLIIALALHGSILILFKYQLFWPKKLNVFFLEQSVLSNILIPLGVSIYVLQGASYLIDLFLRKIKVQTNFVKLGTYIAFFPQSICGPIVRYSDMSNELMNREDSLTKASKGYSLFIRGLTKKIFLADSMLMIWDDIKFSGYESLPILTAWIGMIAFSFAVYFYFSGYSEMARGIAKIFGFEIPINFNYPYVAKSISEFWRRWNVTLTVWLKTYIFTPLGKNSNSFFLTTFKLLGLWILTGLWYGGSLHFFMWGLAIGSLIIVEKLFFSSWLSKLPVFLQKIYTLIVLWLVWVIFAVEHLGDVLPYWKSMFSGKFADENTLYLLSRYWFLFIACILCSSNIWHTLGLKYEHDHPQLVQWFQIIWEIGLTIFCLVILISGIIPSTEFFVRF